MKSLLLTLIITTPLYTEAQKIESLSLNLGVTHSNQNWIINPEFTNIAEKEKKQYIVSNVWGISMGIKGFKKVSFLFSANQYTKGFKDSDVAVFSSENLPVVSYENYRLPMKYYHINFLADFHKLYRGFKYSFLIGPKIELLRNVNSPFNQSTNTGVPSHYQIHNNYNSFVWGAEAGLRVTKRFKKLGVAAGLFYSYDGSPAYLDDRVKVRNNSAYLNGSLLYYFKKPKGCGCL
ncbi:MAG: hypothetical protein ACK4K0_05060 [Flavobacteriales bacterium]